MRELAMGEVVEEDAAAVLASVARPMEDAEWYFEEEEDDDAAEDELAAAAAAEVEAEEDSVEEEDEDSVEDSAAEEDEDSVAAAAAAAELAALLEQLKAAAAQMKTAGASCSSSRPFVSVDIWSLRAGQEYFGRRPHCDRVRICAVEVGHAPALEAILREVPDASCQIPLLPRLSRLAKLDILLTLGIEAHAPIIAERLPIIGHIPIINNQFSVYGRPNAVVCEHLKAFSQWSWDLHTAATKVGPARMFGEDFLAMIKRRVCKRCRKIVAGALTGRSDQWLRPRISDLVVEMLTIKQMGLVVFEEAA